MSPARALAAAGLAVALAGCALTRRSTPLEVAHYTPEHTLPPRLTSGQPLGRQEPRPGALLRLGRVSSDTGLGERIVFRDGSFQVRFYEGRRWTERPEVYVRRALSAHSSMTAASIRARRRCADARRRASELRGNQDACPARGAHRAPRRALDGSRSPRGRGRRLEPVAHDDFDDVVAALSRALDRISDDVTLRVARHFRPDKPRSRRDLPRSGSRGSPPWTRSRSPAPTRRCAIRPVNARERGGALPACPLLCPLHRGAADEEVLLRRTLTLICLLAVSVGATACVEREVVVREARPARPCAGGVSIEAHRGPRGRWHPGHWRCPAVVEVVEVE